MKVSFIQLLRTMHGLPFLLIILSCSLFISETLRAATVRTAMTGGTWTFARRGSRTVSAIVVKHLKRLYLFELCKVTILNVNIRSVDLGSLSICSIEMLRNVRSLQANISCLQVALESACLHALQARCSCCGRCRGSMYSHNRIALQDSSNTDRRSIAIVH